ncbi:hypothetical protein [Nodularia sp. LEGE 06071]|uniref:hypothetical protein n=2 Tax=unclassified Nodularia (in: cyanobacteria) TaxID=2656917 RepID=UPI0030D92C67
MNGQQSIIIHPSNKFVLVVFMVQDILFCLKEATSYYILKKYSTPKNSAECFINPPCGCANPGKELKCEDCTYLEACLSHFKLGHKPMP